MKQSVTLTISRSDVAIAVNWQVHLHFSQNARLKKYVYIGDYLDGM